MDKKLLEGVSLGYLGKFTLTLGRRRQRMYSIDNMESIEYKRAAIEKFERHKVEAEANKKWLLEFSQELEKAFEGNQDVLSVLKNTVFQKWEEHNFNRTAYLAPIDVYNALADFSDDVQSKAKEVGENLRTRFKHEVYKKD